MTELLVGKISEFGEGDRRIVAHGKTEIGIFCWQGGFTRVFDALRARCEGFPRGQNRRAPLRTRIALATRRFCPPYGGYALAAMAAAAITLAPLSSARAQTPAEFYKGRSIELDISSSVGGGYDVYARLLARHLGKFVPGNPTIVPRNMEGAGGLRLANFLYNAAPGTGRSWRRSIAQRFSTRSLAARARTSTQRGSTTSAAPTTR
jgi:hypothetical protein